MRTRTLLLLAVVCGLAILAAGVALLLQLAGQDDAATVHAVGDAVEVGDLTVVVERYDESATQAVVTIRAGGVEDVDGADEFRLVLAGDSLRALPGGGDACVATTVEAQTCTLTFDVADAAGGARFLIYRRGDDVARWELVDRAPASG